jgi:uridine phosphorylase
LPVPGVVIADRAIRDEGTSYHYLPPARTVEAPASLANALERQVKTTGLPVARGLVWTTDAPYRETADQIARHGRGGALAVEMQAASLFAFSARCGVATGVIAHVTNAPNSAEPPFQSGTTNVDRRLLEAACRAGWASLEDL